MQYFRPDTTLPYFDTLTQNKDGYFVPPPADVRLSDRLVFLIIAHIMYPGKLHNARWPADFNTDGDIVLERWPMGDAVVLWMHGLPFLPEAPQRSKLKTFETNNASVTCPSTLDPSTGHSLSKDLKNVHDFTKKSAT
ncbi:unnamed protein product [Penicillium viridicatum]